MHHNRTVFLEGRRVYLRPPCETDLPFLIRWFNNPMVRVYLNTVYPMHWAAERKWLEKQGERKDGGFVLIIVLKGRTPAQDRPIGTIGIHGIETENRVATTGSAIGETDCWDKGYGTEAKMILLEHLFNTLNLRKIYSQVIGMNGRSAAYSKKCGYREEARLPKHHFRQGEYHDNLILAVYADEWRALWARTKKKYLP